MSEEETTEHNWDTFSDWFIGLFPYIPHDEAPPQCAWALGATFEQTRGNYRQVEAPFVSDIEGVIREFCETSSVEEPSKAVKYFLGLRSAVLESFFIRFWICDGAGTHSSIVPFPPLPTMRVVRWFMIDWWRMWGASAISLRRYYEEFPIDYVR